VVYGGFDPLDVTISTYLPWVESTGHSGSSGVLIMLASQKYWETAWTKKVWRRRRRRTRTWIYGRFL